MSWPSRSYHCLSGPQEDDSNQDEHDQFGVDLDNEDDDYDQEVTPGRKRGRAGGRVGSATGANSSRSSKDYGETRVQGGSSRLWWVPRWYQRQIALKRPFRSFAQ